MQKRSNLELLTFKDLTPYPKTPGTRTPGKFEEPQDFREHFPVGAHLTW